MLTNKKALAAVALLLVVFLGVFGIDRLGGETWFTSAAKTEAGWYAEVRPYARPPVPFLRQFFLPVVMIVIAAAVAGIGAVLNRFSQTDDTGSPNESLQ